MIEFLYASAEGGNKKARLSKTKSATTLLWHILLLLIQPETQFPYLKGNMESFE